MTQEELGMDSQELKKKVQHGVAVFRTLNKRISDAAAARGCFYLVRDLLEKLATELTEAETAAEAEDWQAVKQHANEFTRLTEALAERISLKTLNNKICDLHLAV